MKILLVASAFVLSAGAYAQAVTDSITTSIGDFVVVSTEELEESSGYTAETISTSDGGTVELVTIGSSGARLASSAVVSDLNMLVAPNPSSDVVELNISGVEGVTSIVVTNILGQIVYSANVSVNETQTAYLPANLWSSGTYIIVASTGGQVVCERLIVD